MFSKLFDFFKKFRKPKPEKPMVLWFKAPQPMIDMGLDFSDVKLDGVVYGYQSCKQLRIAQKAALTPEMKVFEVVSVQPFGPHEVRLEVISCHGGKAPATLNSLRFSETRKTLSVSVIPEIGEDNEVLSFNRVVFTL